jgi:hypothetical protein
METKIRKCPPQIRPEDLTTEEFERVAEIIRFLRERVVRRLRNAA